MHRPIPSNIRTAGGKAILSNFPVAIEPLDLNRSAVFALQANGGADDRWALGPYRTPTIIEAIHYVSELDAALSRTFSIHLSSDPQTTILYPSDINILDPLSPSTLIMPGRTGVTLRLGTRFRTTHPWIKLSRQKGGSAAFNLTCWIYMRSAG